MDTAAILPPEVAVAGGALCVLSSLFCLMQLHLKHRWARTRKRLLWTAVVLVPLAGPMLYGAWFHGIVCHKSAYVEAMDPGEFLG